jgi:hypothetical protein
MNAIDLVKRGKRQNGQMRLSSVRSAARQEVFAMEYLTNHTKETAHEWLLQFIQELQKCNVEYKTVTFIEAALAVAAYRRIPAAPDPLSAAASADDLEKTAGG